MCSFLLGFPHCSRQLCSPWALRTALYTPDKSTQAEKKYQGTKALYVMLSSCIDFSPCIFDRQHKIVASCHVKLGLGDRIGSASITQFFGRNVSWTRHCGETLTVSNLFVWTLNTFVAFTQRHIYKLPQKLNLKSDGSKLCILDHKAVWSTVSEAWVCFISGTVDGWIQGLEQ